MCSAPSSNSTERAPRIGSSWKLRPGGSPLRRSVYRALTAAGSETRTIGRSKPRKRTLKALPKRSPSWRATASDLKLLSSGKVREIYEWDDELLMVASDRISIYDVVMPTSIPDKGKVLNRMSIFWFGLTEDIVPNHYVSEDVPEEAVDRGMRVKRLE